MQSVTTFDMPQMLRVLGGDHARLAVLANRVRSEIPHHIRTMRENLTEGRLRGLEFSARYFGMLFESLLAQDAAEAARDLESAARRLHAAESQVAFESLEDEVEALLQDLAEIHRPR